MSPKLVQSHSLSSQIADALREAIVTGELRHGEPLTQESVAAMYSVSAMPAREALLALSRDGMVDAKANRGFRVARMAREDVEDVYWTHGIVAGRLAGRACLRLSEHELVELTETNAKLLSAVEAGDIEEVEALNVRFHIVLNVAADSPRLSALLKTTISQIPRSFYTRLPEWDRFSYDDHERLLGVLRRRNPKRAEKMLVEHVDTEAQMMMRYLSSLGYWDEGSRPVAAKDPLTSLRP